MRSGTSAAPAFWQVERSEYHAPRDAGSGNHARKMFEIDGQPNDWTKPLPPQMRTISGSDSVLPIERLRSAVAMRQATRMRLGDAMSMSTPLSSAHVPYTSSCVEPSRPASALLTPRTSMTEGSQKP